LRNPFPHRGHSPNEPQDAQPKYLPVFFNAAEWAFVNAAVDRLIPAPKVAALRSPAGHSTPSAN
jgi:hypothetical protein